MGRFSGRRVVVAAAWGVVSLAAVRPAVADECTWSGAGTTTNWTNAFNWAFVDIPDEADETAVFSGEALDRKVVVNQDFNIAEVRFDNGAFTGKSFSLSGSGVLTLGQVQNTSPAAQTISNPIRFAGRVDATNPYIIRNHNDAGDYGGLTFNSISFSTAPLQLVPSTDGIGLSGGISGTGPLIIDGPGQVDLGTPPPQPGNLTPSNAWTGGMTIRQGTVNIANANAVSYPNGRGRAGLPIAISSGGGLKISSTLSLPNAFTFNTKDSRIEVVGGATASLSGAYACNISNRMHKTGDGTLVLTGDGSAFSGQAIVDAGVLRVTTGFGNTDCRLIVNGGAFESGNGTAIVLTSINGAGDVRLGDSAYLILGYTVNLNGVVRGYLGGGTLTGTISGTNAAVVEAGSELLTLGGNNTYTGPTFVSSSGLRLLGTYATRAFAVASGASLEFSPAADTDYAATTFSGGGKLVKTGAGTASWGGGAATFALGDGAVIDVQQGTFVGGSYGNESWTYNKSDLNVAAGARFNTVEANVLVNGLTGSGTVTTGYNGSGYATLAVGVNDGGGTFGGVIANTTDNNVVFAGKLTKEGVGTQTLTGANTYTGGTVVNGGTLSVGDGGTRGSLAPAGAIAVNAGGNLTLDRSDNVLQSDVLSTRPITGAGSFTKAGAGTLGVTVVNTYTGGTAVDGGTLSIGTGGTTGSLAAAGTIVIGPNGNLAINRSNNVQQTVVLSGSPITGDGSFTKAGAGTLQMTLANTYTGGTTIADGRLILVNGNARIGTGPVSNSAALEYYALLSYDGLTLDNTISGTGTVNATANGPLTLTADNTYTGATTVTYGRLRLAGRSASSGFGIAGGGVLELTPSAATDNGTTTFTGNGTLLKTGVGTSFWGSGAATFAFGSGALIDVQAGTFVGGNSANENWTNNKSDLNVAGGATFGGVEANVRVDALSGGGTVSTGYSGVGYSTFTVGVDNGSGTFAGTIANTSLTTPGKLTKAGAGTQTLTGANTYTGGTVITAGTLALGNGGVGGRLSAVGAVSVAAGANFTVNRSDAAAQGADFGSITGAGAFTKAGPGTLTLSFNNPYTGLTTVAAGTLRSATLASNSALLNNTSGVDLAAGATLELAYTSNNPAAVVRSILAAGYGLDSKFATGQIRSSTLAAGRGIGYADNGSTVTVRVTLAGDADLDGGVSINDFNALAAHFGQATGRAWVDGDFDYDGGVSINDFNLLAAGFGRSVQADASVWPVLLAFAAAHDDLAAFETATGVPEPTGLAAMAVAAAIGSRRKRASR